MSARRRRATHTRVCSPRTDAESRTCGVRLRYAGDGARAGVVIKRNAPPRPTARPATPMRRTRNSRWPHRTDPVASPVLHDTVQPLMQNTRSIECKGRRALMAAAFALPLSRRPARRQWRQTASAAFQMPLLPPSCVDLCPALMPVRPRANVRARCLRRFAGDRAELIHIAHVLIAINVEAAAASRQFPRLRRCSMRCLTLCRAHYRKLLFSGGAVTSSGATWQSDVAAPRRRRRSENGRASDATRRASKYFAHGPHKWQNAGHRGQHRPCMRAGGSLDGYAQRGRAPGRPTSRR